MINPFSAKLILKTKTIIISIIKYFEKYNKNLNRSTILTRLKEKNK
ncbi:MAG: hypothetical protein BAJALOKI1v1_280019 [Promethearchaeota archaeon]|nr:MAG: hypothetical protein BAJALOKI1v1_280019 [Candidatus Lokiarchaeota archaeon]